MFCIVRIVFKYHVFDGVFILISFRIKSYFIFLMLFVFNVCSCQSLSDKYYSFLILSRICFVIFLFCLYFSFLYFYFYYHFYLLLLFLVIFYFYFYFLFLLSPRPV